MRDSQPGSANRSEAWRLAEKKEREEGRIEDREDDGSAVEGWGEGEAEENDGGRTTGDTEVGCVKLKVEEG